MYKHIVIPTDGTALSESALEKGLTFARGIGAKVTVTTTIEPAPMLVAAYVQIAESQARYHLHAVEQAARHLDGGEDQGRGGRCALRDHPGRA